VSDHPMEIPLMIARNPISSPYLQRVLSPAFLILGLVLTLAWTALLGFGFVALLEMTL
jgi:hypothetical protein